MGKLTHRWTKFAAAKWEDAWVERLQFLGPHNVAIISKPNSPLLKIEAFCSKPVARSLVRSFGGKVEEIPSCLSVARAPSKPLSIRGRLRVYMDSQGWLRNGGLDSNPPAILIPAGMAFGTGDHATTATCLRMLCDLVPRLGSGFSAIDAGAGSGILSIAAAKLGGRRVDAIENDPTAVKTARENVRCNAVRGIKIHRASVLEWQPHEPVSLVTANLFSRLLVSSSERMYQWLVPGGYLVVSGVLVPQWEEVCDALTASGFCERRVVARGRWVAATLQRSIG